MFHASSYFELTIAAPSMLLYVQYIDKSIYTPKQQAGSSWLSKNSLHRYNRKVCYEQIGLQSVGLPTPYPHGECPQSVGATQVIAPHFGSSTAKSSDPESPTWEAGPFVLCPIRPKMRLISKYQTQRILYFPTYTNYTGVDSPGPAFRERCHRIQS